MRCSESCTAREAQPCSSGYNSLTLWLTHQLAYYLTILILLMTAFTSSPATRTYVPKSQRQAFNGPWVLIGSWLNDGFQMLDCMISALDTKAYRKKPKVRWRTKPAKGLKSQAIRTRLLHAFATELEVKTQAYEQAVFDSDSFLIRVDNCATASISNLKKDFIEGTLVPTRKKVKGLFGPSQAGVMTGTICWNVADDNGVAHEFLLSGSYYVPWATSRLLSPQHWAQCAKDNKPLPRGTWCATYADSIILEWNQRRYRRTIQLDRGSSNVAHIRTAPGYNRATAFAAEAGLGDEVVVAPIAAPRDPRPVVVAPPARPVVSDDEDERAPSRWIRPWNQQPEGDVTYLTGEEPTLQREAPLVTDFNLNGPSQDPSVTAPNVIEDEEDHMPQEASAEFLKWHHRLGHLSPVKMKIMARMGMLPKSLITCPVPLCTACLFGKATRRPWRTRAMPSKSDGPRSVTRPGHCVSIDQLVSTTPGLIAQAKGACTTKRYRVATVFVDQYSRLSYTHIQKGATAVETVEAKDAFERFASSHGVQVLHYHADNGIFADNLFRKAVADKHQTLSFCGVNAHWQNGIAERRIRELQDHARTMLVHANKRWPTAINAHLWPYALRMANDMHNATPAIKSPHLIPSEAFSGSQVAPNPNHWHHFGSPVYVLDNALQSAEKIDKWTQRARVGIYLGRSSQHARTVALVLSLETGLTSPQFHIKIDSTFQTMRSSFGNTQPASLWQQKCGFTKEPHGGVTPAPTTGAAGAPAPTMGAAAAAGPAPAAN